MALDENISGLIGRIYEGALDGDKWAAAIDEALQRTGSRMALMAVVDTRKHAYATTSYHGRLESRFADTAREYEQGIFLIDPSFDFVIANPTARFFDTAVHIEKATYLDDPYVRWSIARVPSSHWIAGFTPEDDGFTFAASFHSATLLEPHAEQNNRLFRMLFEHMERARRLAVRPPGLELADGAMVLLDARGSVQTINAAAERIIAAEPALSLHDRTLRPAAPAERKRWDGLVRSALTPLSHGGAGGAMALPRARGGRPLLITIDPLPAQAGLLSGRGARAMIRIVDPDTRPPRAVQERWMALFDLTPAEAKLAGALLDADCNLRLAADRCGVAYATARSQLASIFRKTDTHSQPELVRLLSAVSR